MSARCKVCDDTGKTSGSYDLDCASCDVAGQRVALNKFSHEASDSEGDLADLLWQVHQRAVEQEREKARAALEEIVRLNANGNYAAHVVLRDELKRIAL